LEAANPELAALVRHVGLRGRRRGSQESPALQQTSHEKESHHRNTEAEIGQGELWQQRDGALTAAAQIAANAQEAIKVHLHQGSAVEALSAQRPPRLALRAMIGPVTIGIGNRFVILLEGAGERV
jgi:hypothetical protein